MHKNISNYNKSYSGISVWGKQKTFTFLICPSISAELCSPDELFRVMRSSRNYVRHV